MERRWKRSAVVSAGPVVVKKRGVPPSYCKFISPKHAQNTFNILNMTSLQDVFRCCGGGGGVDLDHQQHLMLISDHVTICMLQLMLWQY